MNEKIMCVAILCILITTPNVLAVPERIVSIAPSNTEILFALGLGDKIVGVTDYCDYPEEAKSKPKVGGFYNPSIETIVSLEPDIVFATTGIQTETAENLRDLNITVYQVNINSIEDILIEIQNIGDITGKTNEAEALVSGLRNRINVVEEKTKALPENEKPKVYIEIWTYWTSGKNTFAYDLIEKAGGKNAFDINQGWFLTNAENVINANPDVILLAYTGWVVDPEEIKSREGFEFINAVKNDKIFNINPDTIAREGPRIVDSLEEIALILYPGLMNSFSVNPTTITLVGDLGSNVSASFTVTNRAINNSQDIEINTDIDQKYKLVFSETSFSLGEGETKSITLNAFIPEYQDIKTSLIGTVKLIGREYNNSFLLYIKTNSKLEIKSLKAYVNGEKESKVDENGGKIKDIAPGSQLKLKIEVANLDLEMKLDDIEIEAVIEDIDDDLEKSIDLNDLDGKEDDTVSLTFDIPLYVAEGKYDLDIIVRGDDENNVEHSDNVQLILEIEKEKQNIILNKLAINHESIGCDRDIEIYTEIINLGSDDWNIKLLIQNSDLQLDKEENFELQSGDDKEDTTYSRTFLFKINNDIAEGLYPVNVKVLYGDKSEEEVINLEIKKCEQEVEQNTIISAAQEQNIQQATPLNIKTTAKVVTQPVQKSYFIDKESFLDKNKHAIFIAIAGFNVFLIITLALLIKFLFKKT